MLSLERFAEKSADNLINSIEDSKKVPFTRVLYALGIRYVGETVAKKIALHLRSIDKLAGSDVDELIEVEEIGDIIAESIYRYFNNEKNRELISRLKNAGIQFEIKEESVQNISDKLSGKSIIISGVFQNFSRDEIKVMIEKHGGKNVTSISSKTDYLVAGENIGPSKLEKARKLKIPILSEDEFINLIQ